MAVASASRRRNSVTGGTRQSLTTLLFSITSLSGIAGQHCAVGDFQRRLSKYPALQRLILLFGPGDVARDQRHDGHAETADQKLSQRRTGTRHQRQTGGQRE